MKVVMPPERYQTEGLKVFLAGSIEMGKAVDWQTKITQALDGYDLTIYNPRRADWDSSWKQEISNPQFNGQVSWELDNIENSDIVVFFFQGETMSPISLLELGFVAGRGIDSIVLCQDSFWRKGNVDILCSRHDNIHVVNDFEKIIQVLKHVATNYQPKENP